MKDFKLGEPVIFCDGWGLTLNQDKTFRWGELKVGFISGIEKIESRNSVLYTVSTVRLLSDKVELHTKLLGPHLIFKTEELALARETLKNYCEEI